VADFNVLIWISVLTFIDGLFFVGLFIIGWASFFAISAAYSTGSFGILDLTLYTFAGVALAEQISFVMLRTQRSPILNGCNAVIGWIIAARAKHKWLLFLPQFSENTLENGLAKANRGLDRFGPLFMIIGRWTTLSSLVPGACSLSAMTWKRFSIISAISCFLWSLIWNGMAYATAHGLASFN
jgi:membrane protein DedA with SNARE-associated domain